MNDQERYGSNDQPHHNGIYDEGRYSYGSYEQHENENYGGVDANVVDYNDGYNDDGSGDYELDNKPDDDLFDNYSREFNKIGPGLEMLLSILETAVQQHHDETTRAATMTTGTTIPEDIQRSHREHLEKTWKAIRTHWLWAHETVEERSVGARFKGESDLAPLHLICKLTANPPTDILNEIVKAAPEATEWEDAHGWIPLHHACIHGASTEVLKLLTKMYPESRTALDAHHRTPLHLYATRGISDHYNPVTLATNFAILCASTTTNNDEESTESIPEVSPAEVRDTAGMLPMHYACAYGTTKSVLRVLEGAFPESLEARDDHGRTPLHFVMVNAQRGASPGVLGYLLGHRDNGDEQQDDDEVTGTAGAIRGTLRNYKPASVNVRDRGGSLPLHLLNLGMVGADFDRDPDKLWNVAECLKLYLEAQPHVSMDFLAALQALPDPLQDVAVVSPHVRNILNAKIIQRFPTSILVSGCFTNKARGYSSIGRFSMLSQIVPIYICFNVYLFLFLSTHAQMLDGIMLVTMIVCFELATTHFVDQVVAADGPLENTQLSSPLVMLYVTTSYFFLRELIQVIASLTLGAFGSWLYDTTNWLDVLVIALVTIYTTAMTLGETDPIGWGGTTTTIGEDDDLGGFRTGTALTKGVLWTAVIFFLKSTQVDFAVFLNGVFYVVQRLVAFLLAILVILISFAQMFWLVYLEQPVCKFSCREGDNECEAEMEGCKFPHCEFGDSFLKVRACNIKNRLCFGMNESSALCDS
jgi:ankyrin repeat protein